MQHFASTPKQRNENIKYSCPRVGLEPTTCHVYTHKLVLPLLSIINRYPYEVGCVKFYFKILLIVYYVCNFIVIKTEVVIQISAQSGHWEMGQIELATFHINILTQQIKYKLVKMSQQKLLNLYFL